MKYCSKCKQCKPFAEFHKSKAEKDGFAHWCKICATANTRRHHAKNKHNLEYKNKRRDTWIQTTHGITLEEYEEKLLLQNSQCAICNVVVSGKSAHLDHDHESGQLRKFLCTNCNRGLGHFQDNPALLLGAALYLRSHRNE